MYNIAHLILRILILRVSECCKVPWTIQWKYIQWNTSNGIHIRYDDGHMLESIYLYLYEGAMKSYCWWTLQLCLSAKKVDSNPAHNINSFRLHSWQKGSFLTSKDRGGYSSRSPCSKEKGCPSNKYVLYCFYPSLKSSFVQSVRIIIVSLAKRKVLFLWSLLSHTLSTSQLIQPGSA